MVNILDKVRIELVGIHKDVYGKLTYVDMPFTHSVSLSADIDETYSIKPLLEYKLSYKAESSYMVRDCDLDKGREQEINKSLKRIITDQIYGDITKAIHKILMYSKERNCRAIDTICNQLLKDINGD